MVEVGDRPATDRRAVAEGFIAIAAPVLESILSGTAAKGDVLAVARVAAIQAAKRTWELIPLCHPIALTGLEVRIEPAGDGSGLRLEATARTTGPTGVEMEALTAVQVGLLTLYDMVKSADPAMTIGPVRLLRKEGGRHGVWVSPSSAPAEPFPAEGLPLEEARRLILEALQPLGGSENLPLAEVLGRVSAEPALAREAVPGFRASIMDGYALADAGVPELGQSWRLVGRSAPGAPYEGVLAAGEAIRILTGAPLPEGGTGCCPRSWWSGRSPASCVWAARRGRTPGSAPPTRRPQQARSCWRRGSGSGWPTWRVWPVVVWGSWRCVPAPGSVC